MYHKNEKAVLYWNGIKISANSYHNATMSAYQFGRACHWFLRQISYPGNGIFLYQVLPQNGRTILLRRDFQNVTVLVSNTCRHFLLAAASTLVKWKFVWFCGLLMTWDFQGGVALDLCWIVRHVPRRPDRSRDWTEPNRNERDTDMHCPRSIPSDLGTAVTR